MSVHTSAGSKISIGTTAPASNKTQFEADVYDEIGETVSIGEFGRTYQENTFTSISNRAVRKFKGSYNDGNLTLGIGKDAKDAGQAALQAALDDDRDFNFKVELNDEDEETDGGSTTIYFRAKVMGFTTNINDVNSTVGGTVTLALESGSLLEIPT